MARDFELVVARYKEDVSWLGPFMKYAIIYDKGPMDASLNHVLQSAGAQLRRLENVGREAHTYLSHIIQNYDNLADWTVFTQGHPFDHVRDFQRALINCPKAAGRSPNFWPQEPCGHMCEEFRLAEWAGKVNEPFPGGNFRAFWDQFVRVPYPSNGVVNVYWGAVFAVSKNQILQRPKADYEAMLRTVMTPNPEAGHYFERAWYYLFA